jgi:hypothetical protein
MSSHHYQVEMGWVGPQRFVIRPGHAYTVLVGNTSTSPMTYRLVASTLVRTDHGCVRTLVPVTWAQMSAPRITLGEKQTGQLRVRVAASGPPGPHYLQVAAFPVVHPARGQIVVVDGADVHGYVSYPGHATAASCVRPVAAPVVHHSAPFPLAYVLVAAALVALCVCLWARRRGRGTS